MALEYLKPSTLAGARPMMSCRLGPTLFLPASTVWQALHLLNTFSPAAASPSCARAVPARAVAAVKVRIVRALLTDMSSLRLCRIVLADGVWRGRVVRRRNNVQATETMASGEPITRPGACAFRSEEHTSELQSLMRITYALFFFQK